MQNQHQNTRSGYALRHPNGELVRLFQDAYSYYLSCEPGNPVFLAASAAEAAIARDRSVHWSESSQQMPAKNTSFSACSIVAYAEELIVCTDITDLPFSVYCGQPSWIDCLYQGQFAIAMPDHWNFVIGDLLVRDEHPPARVIAVIDMPAELYESFAPIQTMYPDRDCLLVIVDA
jgi:hypothetical protein